MDGRKDSGLKWPDPNNPLPTDLLWGGGVRGGLWRDGTLYRDVTRYPDGGQLFWCAYFKPGSGPGIKNGFWMNLGHSYAHLHNDDPAQVLTGASQRLYWQSPHPSPSGPASPRWGEAASPTSGEGCRRVVIEATMYVTEATVLVWEGVKSGGSDPTGTYTRASGIDPLPSLVIEAT